MGLLTLREMAVGRAISLGQVQETSAIEWVRLSESIAREFKVEHVGVRLTLRSSPSVLAVSYTSPVDSKFDLSAQNAEMEKIARFAVSNYKVPREQRLVDEIRVTRSETHGRGCFQQTYVSHFTLPNPMRRTELPGFPGGALGAPQR